MVPSYPVLYILCYNLHAAPKNGNENEVWVKKMAMKRRWVTLNTVLLQHISHMFPLTIWESSAMQQCVTPSLADLASTLLLMMILHPPLPLHISPCHLPLPLSAWCSAVNCLFCSLSPLCPLAIVHTTQCRRLLVLHCDCNSNWLHWHVMMTLMTIMSSAVPEGHPVGPVGALSHQPRWRALMTSMTIMQQEATCCPIPIAPLCGQTCHTFVLSFHLPCHPVVPAMTICTYVGKMGNHIL